MGRSPAADERVRPGGLHGRQVGDSWVRGHAGNAVDPAVLGNEQIQFHAPTDHPGRHTCVLQLACLDDSVGHNRKPGDLLVSLPEFSTHQVLKSGTAAEFGPLRRQSAGD